MDDDDTPEAPHFWREQARQERERLAALARLKNAGEAGLKDREPPGQVGRGFISGGSVHIPLLRQRIGQALFWAGVMIGTGGVVAVWIHPLMPLLLVPSTILVIIGSNLQCFGTMRLPPDLRGL